MWEYFRSRRSFLLPNIFFRMLLIIDQDVLKAKGVGTLPPPLSLEFSPIRSARHLKEAGGILRGSPLTHFEMKMGSRRSPCAANLCDLLASQHDISDFGYEL